MEYQKTEIGFTPYLYLPVGLNDLIDLVDFAVQSASCNESGQFPVEGQEKDK